MGMQSCNQLTVVLIAAVPVLFKVPLEWATNVTLVPVKGH